MADQKEIEALYDWLDFFHELRLGKNPDITAAFFDGDFSKALEQAQKDKHEPDPPRESSCDDDPLGMRFGVRARWYGAGGEAVALSSLGNS